MMFLACAWWLALDHKRSWRTQRRKQAFRQLLTRCLVLGLVALIISLLCLFWDLGQPSRALLLLTSPSGAVLSWGVLFLGAEFALVTFLTATLTLDLHVPHTLKRIAIALCAFASIAVFTYTGVYLYSLSAVAFWHSPALIATFAFASLSAGFSLMLLIAYFSPDAASVLGAVKPLQRLHLATLVCEAASIVFLVAQQAANQDAGTAFSLFTSESMLPLFIIGVGGFAIGAPLCFEASSVASRAYRNIPASDALCLAGSLILRYVIVTCGVH